METKRNCPQSTEKESTVVSSPGPPAESHQNFEIGASDECQFVPLVSEEEDRRIAAEIAPKSRYIPLDPDQPTAHLKTYLDLMNDDDAGEEEEEEDLSDL